MWCGISSFLSTENFWPFHWNRIEILFLGMCCWVVSGQRWEASLYQPRSDFEFSLPMQVLVDGGGCGEYLSFWPHWWAEVGRVLGTFAVFLSTVSLYTEVQKQKLSLLYDTQVRPTRGLVLFSCACSGLMFGSSFIIICFYFCGQVHKLTLFNRTAGEKKTKKKSPNTGV